LGWQTRGQRVWYNV